MTEKIVLIDGHSILNRAFYGVPDLTNAKGQHTNAVYGFLNIDGIRKNALKQAELCIKALNFLAVLVSFSVDFYFCIFHNCLYR